MIESNKKVTADNWFTSLDGVKQFEKVKLAYVGIIGKDKRAILVDFRAITDIDPLPLQYRDLELK